MCEPRKIRVPLQEILIKKEKNGSKETRVEPHGRLQAHFGNLDQMAGFSDPVSPSSKPNK